MITIDRLRHLLTYNPSDGRFKWNVDVGFKIKAGINAGFKNNTNGYMQLKIDYKLYQLHRLAWFYMTGTWPSVHIDHKNKNKSDNRWDNLRLANQSENLCNRGKPSTNTSGYKNIRKFTCIKKGKEYNYWCVSTRKYLKKISKLFPYNDKGLEDALVFRNITMQELHGEYTSF